MKQKCHNCLRLCVLFYEYRIWQHSQEPSLRARDAFLWPCTNTDVLGVNGECTDNNTLFGLGIAAVDMEWTIVDRALHD
jgi:hypothetical protein